MKTDVSDSNTSQRRSNPKAAQAWPIKAGGVAAATVDAFTDIALNASAAGKDCDRIDQLLKEGIELMLAGDNSKAQEKLLTARSFAANANHKTAWIVRDAGSQAAAVQKALVGKYD